jgi:hypothetical protein
MMGRSSKRSRARRRREYAELAEDTLGPAAFALGLIALIDISGRYVHRMVLRREAARASAWTPSSAAARATELINECRPTG